MNSNESRNKARAKREKYEDFKKGYIRRHELFCGTTPTEEDIRSTWTCLKNEKKKKRVVPKPPITKEEFFHEWLRGCRMCDDIPTAREFNRLWDLMEFDHQYQAIRGKDKVQRKKAFVIHMEQEILRRYPPTDLQIIPAGATEEHHGMMSQSEGMPGHSSDAGCQGETSKAVWEPYIQRLHDLYSKVKKANPETTSRSQLDQFYDQFLILQEAPDNIGAYKDAIEDYLLAIETMFYNQDRLFVEKSFRSYDLTRYSGKRGGRGY